ncbi:MAG: Xaa-Pro peptidase family protein [Nitrososphaerota archaeon]|nr:Xaa-Pro peptidase family protein [Candidatus Bathyarchaeota archaeon]MDW8061643.1 Xaa-Pro peptidase family protein [Nitrososphaerota archaeon]
MVGISSDAGRISSVKRAMEGYGIDVLVCRNPENVLFLSGYWPLTGWSLVVVPLDGDPALIIPRSELDYARESWIKNMYTYEAESLEHIWNPYRFIAGILEGLDLPKGIRVGCELSMETVATGSIAGEVSYACTPTFDLLRDIFKAVLVDATPLISKLRMVKSNHEIERIKIASKIASIAIEKLLGIVRDGLKESELAALAESIVYSEGVGFEGKVKRARGFAFVMSGGSTSRAWYPFNISSDRRIMRGDPILLEFNVCADGYWVDVTRTWILGRPTKEQEDIFYILMEAQESVYKYENPGVKACDVDRVARKVIGVRGYDRFFPHRLGHGVGLRLHEEPIIHPLSSIIIEKGMIHTVEPGIYTDRYGLRLEDVVLVLGKGVENLFPGYKFLSLGE